MKQFARARCGNPGSAFFRLNLSSCAAYKTFPSRTSAMALSWYPKLMPRVVNPASPTDLHSSPAVSNPRSSRDYRLGKQKPCRASNQSATSLHSTGKPSLRGTDVYRTGATQVFPRRQSAAARVSGSVQSSMKSIHESSFRGLMPSSNPIDDIMQ